MMKYARSILPPFRLHCNTILLDCKVKHSPFVFAKRGGKVNRCAHYDKTKAVPEGTAFLKPRADLAGSTPRTCFYDKTKAAPEGTAFLKPGADLAGSTPRIASMIKQKQPLTEAAFITLERIWRVRRPVLAL